MIKYKDIEDKNKFNFTTFTKSNMKFILKTLIIIYQRIISPLTPSSCRFTPTCSNYALEAIKKKNLITAVKMIIKRISKCHPWETADMIQ